MPHNRYENFFSFGSKKPLPDKQLPLEGPRDPRLPKPQPKFDPAKASKDALEGLRTVHKLANKP